MKLGLFDFAHGVAIYIAEDATVEGVDIAGVAKTFDQARKMVDAYAPILNATFEKKYGARAMNYYIWPSQMFYCNSAIKGLADIKGKKVRVQGTSQGDLVEALGGTGVTIPFAEVVPALQRGTVDCGITGTMPAYKAGWHEVTSHVLTLAGRLLGVVHHREPHHLEQARRQDQGLHRRRHQGPDRQVVADHHRRGHEGLNCTTGTGPCSVGKPGKLIKVEPTAADSAILETAMKDVVLKRWAKRCGADASLHQQLERHRRQGGQPDGRAVILPNRAGWSARDFIRPFTRQAAFRGTRRMQTVLKWFGSASRACAIVAGWALLAISFATVIEILGRKYFGFSFRSLDEIGGYMLAGVSAFGFAYALTKHSHMRVTLLFPYVPASVQSLLNALAMVSLAAMAAFCALRGGVEVLEL